MLSKKKQLPLVSIIVPVYNVEKYLTQCIESIINQDYKNIEIILIDDGSPDQSGQIVDRFALIDPRIKALHINNGGVSAARNLGLSIANGKYIVFVDADDYLSIDYVSYMLNISFETDCDFVISKNCFKVPGNSQQIKNDDINILSPVEAASLLLYPGKVDVGCWNKMYKKQFLLENKITFPENFYMGEGLNFIIRVAQHSNNVGVGKRKVYHYRKDNITSATTLLSVDKYVNALSAIDNIENHLIYNSKSLKNALKIHKYLTIFATIKAILFMDEINKYKKQYKFYLHFLRKNIFNLFIASIPPRTKLIISLYCFSPYIGSKITKYIAKLRK
ncbi:TPA: glycosyltransferase family 2 protein [Proteus mirabilis]|uniref:Gt1 n=1 Tax=Proteus mirabilis TaxID=584 RepID=A0A385JP64_PROMI|nr:glycosyltransferase [Proteus sp. G2675]AXZ00099.1 gt1 [Proteus mirabilis]NBL94923.1 glycosyltransferase [Proteus sp. G2675]HEK0649269.1 glycosyltransferase [Proteus mirabilis]HEK2693007.1 glycosyltransferase [Proteus mirabilis]